MDHQGDTHVLAWKLRSFKQGRVLRGWNTIAFPAERRLTVQCHKSSQSTWYWKLFHSRGQGSPQSCTSFYVCVFSVKVLIIMLLHTAHSSAVITSEGLVIMRAFHCIFHGKMCQTPKYKSEVLAPKSGIKLFNPTLGILKKKKNQGNYQVWCVSLLGSEGF